MFNLFKRKTIKDEKLEIYRCLMCNGSYFKENIDFLVSRKLGKNVCIRCAEFIKNEQNKKKE